MMGLAVFLLCTAFFWFSIIPLHAETGEIISFTVKEGEGARDVATHLAEAGVIRSAMAFYFLTAVSGSAFNLKPGGYDLHRGMSSWEIIRLLVKGPVSEKEIVIVEGATIYDIDKLLSDRGIIKKEALLEYNAVQAASFEGRLFPDTYRFYVNSSASEVAAKMLKNFEQKVLPILTKSAKGKGEKILILASILEKEIPDHEERRVAAGIMIKRIEEGMPLQVDASVCYVKQIIAKSSVPCGTISAVDMEAESPYNTYYIKGWPPGPIGNPGLGAIEAALSPVDSPYWFYLSDPKTGETIFSSTLDEHNRNRVKYLGN